MFEKPERVLICRLHLEFWAQTAIWEISKSLENTLSIGELSLDGRVRPVRGALSIALQARENGITNLLIPEENATEAAVVEGVNVFPVRDLREAVEIAQDLQKGKSRAFRL